ncbi:fructokinase [Arcanobacterium pluranimalium]|uniref:carbohydrate kinase family protein n=1 Tax=Arcanobacterium pluranimalium TaxID=108028 RepID=UPI00195B464E|nr:carbohydrate kinase [Arcanobacterium pluranimalium]MBM7824819.1 fructokinase [Arcanobacterium pluranimalium]
MTILVIGEALIDIFYNQAGAEIDRRPGGSPMNVAIGLARLGRDTSLLTRIGDDAAGDSIVEHCAADRVRLVNGSVTSEPTSLAHAHLGADGSASYTFELHSDYPMPPSDEHEQADLLECAPRLVHIGSIGAHLEPGAAAVKEWIKFYRQKSTISYDPNVRLDVVGPAEKLRGEVESMLEYVDVFKASKEDLEFLYEDLDLDVAVDAVLNAGVALVVITDGGAGLHLYTKEHRVTVPAVKVDVVDTVGAGDSLMSALIDGLGRLSVLGREEVDAIRGLSKTMLTTLGYYAATAASITVTRRGANPPNRQEISAQSEKYSLAGL